MSTIDRADCLSNPCYWHRTPPLPRQSLWNQVGKGPPIPRGVGWQVSRSSRSCMCSVSVRIAMSTKVANSASRLHRPNFAKLYYNFKQLRGAPTLAPRMVLASTSRCLRTAQHPAMRISGQGAKRPPGRSARAAAAKRLKPDVSYLSHFSFWLYHRLDSCRDPCTVRLTVHDAPPLLLHLEE